jgi:hypothetical protein
MSNQSYGTFNNIAVALVKADGTPDTGATLTVKALTPWGTVATFTAPTITEPIAGSGVYNLSFAYDAPQPLFDFGADNGPCALLVKSNSAGSTGYRVIYVKTVIEDPPDLKLYSLLEKVTTLLQLFRGRKQLLKSGAVWSLIVYGPDGTTPILSKVLQDASGANITDVAAGVIAKELATSV